MSIRGESKLVTIPYMDWYSHVDLTVASGVRYCPTRGPVSLILLISPRCMSSSPRTKHADHNGGDLMEEELRPSVSPPNTQLTTADRLLRGALALFAGSITFSVLGMLLLQIVPESLSYFGPYLGTLISAPTWTYMSMLPILALLMYGPALGWKRAAIFAVWGCFIGGASELIGTTKLLAVGDLVLPFGEYEYTAWLGPKFADHVPYFIPASWFAMSIVSFDLARRISDTRWVYLAVAALFMTLWDVSLDPAMNGAGVQNAVGSATFWSYPQGGFYYGMPISNWLGWLGVSYVIMLGYEYLGGGLDTRHAWAPMVYLLNCLFPLLILVMQGMTVAVVMGAVATAIPFVVLRYTPGAAFRFLPANP